MEMQKRIAALKARQNLGQVMNEVSLKGNDYIVERAGKPVVAIISMEKYQNLQEERQKAFQDLDQIWEKMKDEDPKAVEKIVSQAVQAVRKI